METKETKQVILVSDKINPQPTDWVTVYHTGTRMHYRVACKMFAQSQGYRHVVTSREMLEDSTTA